MDFPKWTSLASLQDAIPYRQPGVSVAMLPRPPATLCDAFGISGICRVVVGRPH
jgi:hypothetical protein